MTRKRSDEIVADMLFVSLAFPHRLDSLGAESAIRFVDIHHDSDLVTIRRMREVERLHDGANFNSVFVFHKTIIAFSTKNAIVKTLIESITYEHAFEGLFCLFESGVGEANLVACAPTLNFVTVIPCVPEHVIGTEFVFSIIDEMIEFHLSSSAGYGPV